MKWLLYIYNIFNHKTTYREINFMLNLHVSVYQRFIYIIVNINDGPIGFKVRCHLRIIYIPFSIFVSPYHIEGKAVGDTKAFIPKDPLGVCVALRCQQSSRDESACWNLFIQLYYYCYNTFIYSNCF